MIKIFTKLPFFDNNFEVNEFGVVRNISTGTCLKPYISNKGYYVISFSYKGMRKKEYLHRLVAMAFCPNPYNHPIVMHLDSNRLNCYYKNLKWGTYSENNKQAVMEGHMIVPKPDNRKFYIIYNDSACIDIECFGVSDIIRKTCLTESMVRNYINRNTSITNGIFKNWKIKLK